MKRLLSVIALSVTAVTLFAYDDNLAWVYDTSGRPAETACAVTASDASGVDARANVSLTLETTPAGDALESRGWFAWLSGLLKVERIGLLLNFR